MTRTPALLVVAATLLAACTSSSTSGAERGLPPGTNDTTPTVSPSPVVSFVRTCRSSIYGELGARWRRDALVIGPVAFIGLGWVGSAPDQRFQPKDGRLEPLKVLAIVEAGPPVTVTVAPEGQVALVYDAQKFNSAREVSDGDISVTFAPCRRGQTPFSEFGATGATTQFNGGFIIGAPGCVEISVTSRLGAIAEGFVSFGEGGDCPSP
jgi:hypothetical protein